MEKTSYCNPAIAPQVPSSKSPRASDSFSQISDLATGQDPDINASVKQRQVSDEPTPYSDSIQWGGGTDSVLEVGEMNYQEVNKVSGESWECCWLG